MTRGYVTSYDERRGIGFVQQFQGANRIPFCAPDADRAAIREGDPVEYRVIGGKVGVRAHLIRRVA